jgi:hypothetical protein
MVLVMWLPLSKKNECDYGVSKHIEFLRTISAISVVVGFISWTSGVIIS